MLLYTIGSKHCRHTHETHSPNPFFPFATTDWVADMIDGELYRQAHKKEFENEWMEKNRNAVFSRIESDFVNLDDHKEEFRMHQKDRRLAFKDPEKYCADRCVTTGNCDIFEDFYELSPEDVIKFCTECVLSEDEDGECPIPDGFYDKPRP